MPLHLPAHWGETRGAHPCLPVAGALLLWVLFLPFPIRCLPFPPFEQAGAVPILLDDHLLTALVQTRAPGELLGPEIPPRVLLCVTDARRKQMLSYVQRCLLPPQVPVRNYVNDISEPLSVGRKTFLGSMCQGDEKFCLSQLQGLLMLLCWEAFDCPFCS